jgi:serine phosphatase RsbU (regulator of sigma subunit)
MARDDGCGHRDGRGVRDGARRRARPRMTARARSGRRAALAVLLAGIVVTAGLTALAAVLYDRNEDRLLGLRARELGLLLSSAAASTQTPLASAAALADATHGDAARVRALLAPYVGPGRQFVAAAMWPLRGRGPQPIRLLGRPALPAQRPGQAAALFAAVRRSSELAVTRILRSPSGTRIGYGLRSAGGAGDYAIYAESAIRPDRHSGLSANAAFADLHYAVFLGATTSPADLLVTDITAFPVRGRRSTTQTAFGDRVLTLVVAPNGSLGGTFFRLLPLIIALVGAALTLAATLLTERLAQGRRAAEQLAGTLDHVAAENRRLYAEQHGIAQTLQHALLPEALPQPPGLRASWRFIPGGPGVEIGGDWYDLVPLEDGIVLLVVGDVSGHGVRAATAMAALRHATLAYAVRGDEPAALLSALAGFVARERHDFFATVLCAHLDVAAHRVTAASAGHLPPLVIDGDRAEYATIPVGIPIGAGEPSDYRSTSFQVPPRATLLAFTDGLIERRGEVLDVGLERLARAATAPAASLDELVGDLVQRLSCDDHADDTALVAVRWEH